PARIGENDSRWIANAISKSLNARNSVGEVIRNDRRMSALSLQLRKSSRFYRIFSRLVLLILAMPIGESTASAQANCEISQAIYDSDFASQQTPTLPRLMGYRYVN